MSHSPAVKHCDANNTSSRPEQNPCISPFSIIAENREIVIITELFHLDKLQLGPPQTDIVNSELTKATANSKHWLTASFFQPLPYLVTP